MVPEPVLASTTIPIVTPRVVTGAVTTSAAPVQAVSPRDANAHPPTYPGIPEPGQDLVSLQATVLRLKETVEMMNGTRGDEETDLVGGYLLLQKSTANSSARLEILNQVTANANFAMATRITTLEAEFKNFTGVDPNGTSFSAKMTETLQVYADADEALALRSLNMEAALVMTPGTTASARLNSIESTNVTQGNNITANANAITTLSAQINVGPSSVTARLSNVESVNVTQGNDISAVASRTTNLETTINTPGSGVTARLSTVESVAATANANAATAVVKFGVTGTINGVSGGFTFSGVLKNDNSVAYFMEFEVGTFILRDPSSGAAKTVFSYSSGQFEFNGNVKIHGNLVVTGTINGVKLSDRTIENPKINYNAVSNNSAGSSYLNPGERVTCALTLRPNARALITVMLTDGSASVRASGPSGGYYPVMTCGVYVNGSGFLGNLTALDVLIANNYLGGSSYQFWRAIAPSAAQFVHGPVVDGYHTFQVQNDTGFGCTFAISVAELAV